MARPIGSNNLLSLKKEDYLIFISAVLSFITLFFFRSIDDNRLTSWQWVFHDLVGVKVFLILLAAIPIAYILSRLPFFEKNQASLLFVSSFIFSSLFWGIPELIIDASRYFTQAKYLKEFGIVYFFKEWGKEIFSWTDMPLIPLIYGLVFKLFGEERIYIQIFNSLCFSTSVIITYSIGKTLWDRSVGFYGGLLIMGIPYIYTQVPLMLVDVPTMFFFLVASFSFIKALREGGLWLILSPFLILFAIFTKYSVLVMLSLFPVILVTHILEGSKNTGLLLTRTFYILFPLLILLGAVILVKSDVFLEQLRLLYDYQRPGLRRWKEGFISTFLFQTHPFISLLAFYSLFRALKKKESSYLIIVWLVLLVFVLQIKRIRYLIVIFPMLTLMASYGLQTLKEPQTRRFLVLSLVASSLIISVFGYMPFLKQNSMVNLKKAGEFINTLSVEKVEVIPIPSYPSILDLKTIVPLLDLYIKNKTLIYKGEVSSQGDSSVLLSPLRFTYEYKMPPFYKDDSFISKKRCIVVVRDKADGGIPKNIEKGIDRYIRRDFSTTDNVFTFQVVVYVFYDI